VAFIPDICCFNAKRRKMGIHSIFGVELLVYMYGDSPGDYFEIHAELIGFKTQVQNSLLGEWHLVNLNWYHSWLYNDSL
jgi:hypothetical protein